MLQIVVFVRLLNIFFKFLGDLSVLGKSMVAAHNMGLQRWGLGENWSPGSLAPGKGSPEGESEPKRRSSPSCSPGRWTEGTAQRKATPERNARVQCEPRPASWASGRPRRAGGWGSVSVRPGHLEGAWRPRPLLPGRPGSLSGKEQGARVTWELDFRSRRGIPIQGQPGTCLRGVPGRGIRSTGRRPLLGRPHTHQPSCLLHPRPRDEPGLQGSAIPAARGQFGSRS